MALTSATTRRTSLLVRPSGSAPRPKTISLLSTTSTSKWIATREHPDALPPIEQRQTGAVKLVRTKRCDPPTGDVGEIIFGPGMQTDQSHATWIKGGRQK